MTREEQINIEAKKYYSEPEDTLCYNAFIHGVKFAETLSPWISVEDDLPYKHEELIPNQECPMTNRVIIKTKGGVDTTFMIKDAINNKWIWCDYVKNDSQITHWMPIPEI